MFTWGSKYLLGVAFAAYLTAVVYGLVTGGDVIGVLSYGYKGGIGEHVGYTILMSASVLALLVGTVSVISRDGDSEEMATLAGSEKALSVRQSSGLSIVGPLTAFGIGCLAVGVAISPTFIYLAVAVLAVVALEWTVHAWSDRATGDSEVNTIIRHRILAPVQVPLWAMLAIAVVVLGISRILLAVSEVGSVVVAVVAAAFVFLSAVLIAKSKAPKAIVSAIVTFGALTVLAGGVIAAAVGPRDFHHEVDDHSESEDQPSDDGEG